MSLGNISKSYFDKLISGLRSIDTQSVDVAVNMIVDAWHQGRQVICFGNGGSALSANHFIADWNKMVPVHTGKRFNGRSLCENVGLLTAYSNDMDYESVFVNQIKAILHPGDLVIGISGSGNSENVLRAIQYANENHAKTIGLCSYSGGKLKKLSQHAVHFAVNDMQLAEDFQVMFCHMVMQHIVGFSKNSNAIPSTMIQE